jgi:hypothetical protein
MLTTSVSLGRSIVCSLLLLMLSGCAATQIALEHKNLSVQTQMSATVFLDVERRSEKTAYLDVRNTANQDVNLEPLLRAKLEAKGYKFSTDAKDAFYIIQVNVLQVGKADPSALRDSLAAGYGGALGGIMAGAAASNSYRGAAVGGLIGGAAEVITGSLVKNVTYSVITDLQIMERTEEIVTQTVESSLQQGTGTQVRQLSESVRDRKKYQTRVASTANKVNLKFEEAVSVLQDQLAKSIAGIF